MLRLAGDEDGGAFVDAASAKGVPVSVYDATGAGLRDLYEADLAIVRPDQYVAWRGDALLEDVAALVDRLRGA